MRAFVVVSAIAGCVALGGCNFMNPSGGAAARWAAIDAARVAAANARPGEEKICKTITPIGSIMPKRVCSTESEWAAFDAVTGRTADTFNEMRRSGTMEPATEGSQFQVERQ